jgi:hypothetical protein
MRPLLIREYGAENARVLIGRYLRVVVSQGLLSHVTVESVRLARIE